LPEFSARLDQSFSGGSCHCKRPATARSTMTFEAYATQNDIDSL
jgi:hypothetical protein